MSKLTRAWKVTTHDCRPPVQGGDPIWPDDDSPFRLPVVKVDRSGATCSHGWNACRKPEDALRIGGLWPSGRPSRLWRLRTYSNVVEVGDKLRASTWTREREVAEPEIESVVRRWTKTWAGPVVGEMVESQMAWRAALARPLRDPAAVEQGLAEALAARGLPWKPVRYDNDRDAWDARDAWNDQAAWAAWGVRDAWAARVAWDARDAWAARDAWNPRGAWNAWNARGARDARDARAALVTQYCALRGWVKQDPQQMTVGIRDAYHNGLALAIPVGPARLGWTMEG